MTAALAVELDRAAAQRLTAEIRNALGVADELLARAFAGRVWAAYGHADWTAYCAAELPELRHLKMRTAPRRERAAALAALGATVREVAAATGASVGTAHNDLRVLSAAPAVSAAPVCRTARTLELVAAAGERGLTVEQLRRATRWHHGAASAVLSRLAAAGRIDYRRPAKRGQMGTYAL